LRRFFRFGDWVTPRRLPRFTAGRFGFSGSRVPNIPNGQHGMTLSLPR